MMAHPHFWFLAPARSLEEAAYSPAERAADQRAFLPVDDSTDAGTGGGRAADDQRALRPRSVRAPNAVLRHPRCAIHGRRPICTADTFHAGHWRDMDEGIADNRQGARSARHDHWSSERRGAE